MKIATAITTFIAIAILQTSSAFAISAAVKSQQDYVLTLDSLREVNIMVENFGTDIQKKKFEDLKALFRKAAEKYYAREFTSPDSLTDQTVSDNASQNSVELFQQLKIQMSGLSDELSVTYIAKTQNILDSTSKEVNDILINYGKNSGLYNYFYKPIDPLTEKKPYTAGNYHFFRDKQSLETFLKNGYKALQDAKNLYNHPDFIYLKEKKNKTSADLDSMLVSELKVIKFCRLAKQYGIEIHKLMKINQLGDIQKTYNMSLGTISKLPLFDDRIPEDYKVDAIDNMGLVYTIEKSSQGYTGRKTADNTLSTNQP